VDASQQTSGLVLSDADRAQLSDHPRINLYCDATDADNVNRSVIGRTVDGWLARRQQNTPTQNELII